MPTTSKPRIAIRKATRRDSSSFLRLVDALADYEKLKRPTPVARRRLLRDSFGPKKKLGVWLAFVKQEAVGYAITFETYSSFLALPTLYLEDLFILKEFRGHGVGKKLFLTCLKDAQKRGCGRMEWVVLDWNKPAIGFYDNLGARELKGWIPYRIQQKDFSKILGKNR